MIDKKKKYKLGDFNYSLPKKFIAQYPETKRDYSKLMVVHKDSGEIEHRKFYNIVDYMRKNDLLVINNTKVFPARLFATKDRTDAKVEVFLLRELSENLWEVMVRPARKVRIGNKLVFTPMWIKVWNIIRDASPNKDILSSSSKTFKQTLTILKDKYKKIKIKEIEIKDPNSSDTTAII